MELFNQIFSEESLTVIVYIAVLFLLGILFGWLLRNAGVRRVNKKLKEVEGERFALKSQLDTVEKDSGLKGADMKRINLELIDTKTYSKKLTLEKNSLSAKVNRLESSEASLKQEVDRLSREYKILNGSYQSASLKAKKASSELESKDADVNALTTSVAELEAKIAELVRARQQENGAYAAQVADLKKTLGNSNNHVSMLVEDKDREIEALNEQITALRQAANQNKNMVMASSATSDSGEVDTLKAKIEELEGIANNASKARNQQYETAIRALNAQLWDLKRENDALVNSSGEKVIDAGEIKILEETIADLKSKNESLATNLGKENETLQAQISELQKALTTTSKGDESESLKAKNRELKKALAQNAALRQELDGMSDVQAKFDRQKISFRDMLLKQNQYIIRIEKLQKQLDEMENMQVNLTSAAGTDSYDEQLKALEAALEQANVSLKSIEGEKATIAGELTGFKSKVSKLEQEKFQIEEEYSQQVATIMSESRSTESVTAQFEARIADLEKQIETTVATQKEQEAANEKEKHDLITQIESLQLAVEAAKSSGEETNTNANQEVEALKIALVKLEAERKEEQVQFLKELNEMKDDHKELLVFESKKVETAQDENNRLIGLIDDLKAQMSNLETDKFTVEEDVNELDSEHKNQLSVMNQQLSTVRDENMKLQIESEDLKTQLSETETSKFQAEEDVDEIDADYQNQISIVNTQLSNVRDENMQLQQLVADLKAEMSAIETSKFEADEDSEEQAADHEGQLTVLNTQLSTVRDENMKLEQQLADLRAEMSAVEMSKFQADEDSDEQTTDHEGQLTVLNTQLSTVRDENMQLQQQLDDLKAEMSAVETAKFQSDEEVDEIDSNYQEQLTVINTQLSTVRDENMQLEQQLADLRAEMSAVEMSKFQADEDSDEQTADHEGQLTVLNTQLSTVRDENMELQQQLDDLKAEMTAVETSKFEAEEEATEIDSNYQSQLTIVNTQLSSVRDENMQLEQQLADLRAQMSEVETSKFEADEEATEQHAEHEEQLTVVNTQLSTVRDENMQLQQQLDDLKAEMSAVETLKFQAEEEATEIDSNYQGQLTIVNTQLSTVRDENMQLQQQLEDLKEKMSEVETLKFQAEEEANEQGSDYQNQLAILNSQLSGVRDENMRLANDLTGVTSKLNQLKKIGASGKATGVVNENQAIMAARKAVTDLIGKTIPYATADEKDDLKLINGIGSFIETKLNNLGLYTYEQIGAFNDDIIEKVTDAIQFFPGRIQRDKWAEQARKLDE
jgi:chromosome segregation ATPase